MNDFLTTIGPALIGLFGAALGSGATLIATVSPPSRRISRLERLAALRLGVSDKEACLSLDLAMSLLSRQVAEDAHRSGDRSGFRLNIICYFMLVGGVAAVAYGLIRTNEESADGWVLAIIVMGLLWCGIAYGFLVWTAISSQKLDANYVSVVLSIRRSDGESEEKGTALD